MDLRGQVTLGRIGLFFCTGDPTPCRLMARLRRCLRVLDFTSDIDPGPDLSGGGGTVVWPSNGPSGALALTGVPLLAEVCAAELSCRECLPGQ